jgi:hypothetical protein
LKDPLRGAKESATASPCQGEAQEAAASEQNYCHSKKAALSKQENPNRIDPNHLTGFAALALRSRAK